MRQTADGSRTRSYGTVLAGGFASMRPSEEPEDDVAHCPTACLSSLRFCGANAPDFDPLFAGGTNAADSRPEKATK